MNSGYFLFNTSENIPLNQPHALWTDDCLVVVEANREQDYELYMNLHSTQWSFPSKSKYLML